jgi:hypothetical protein
MRKNVGSQVVSAHLVATADGSDVTSGTTTVYVCGDGGTQASGGTATHEGNGSWSFLPSQANTNYDHVVFTFVNASAISVDIQLYPVSYNPGDSVRLGLTALPNAAAEAAGGLYTRGTGAGQINQAANGMVDVNIQRLNNVAQSLLDLVDFADAGYDPATNKVEGVKTVDTTVANSDMRGTDDAALASVLGALADAAADGDPTASDTLMAYAKQLINVLMGTAGIVAFPAEAVPGNGASLAEVIRAIYNDTVGLAGEAMRGTNSAALASVCTEGRLQELDAANLPTDIAAIPTVMVGTDNAALASVCTEARLAELDGVNLPADIAAVPTAAENRTEMDSNSTRLSAIETDTQDLQTQIGVAGAGLSDLGGMSAESYYYANDNVYL